jgi:hypothetical protein
MVEVIGCSSIMPFLRYQTLATIWSISAVLGGEAPVHFGAEFGQS